MSKTAKTKNFRDTPSLHSPITKQIKSSKAKKFCDTPHPPHLHVRSYKTSEKQILKYWIFELANLPRKCITYRSDPANESFGSNTKQWTKKFDTLWRTRRIFLQPFELKLPTNFKAKIFFVN